MCVDWGGDNDRIDRINFGGLDVIIIKKRVNNVVKAMFRGGNNLGGRYYFPKHEENENEENILQSFLGQYY